MCELLTLGGTSILRMSVNPDGIAASSPGLREALPWVSVPKIFSTPKGLRQLLAVFFKRVDVIAATLSGLVDISTFDPGQLVPRNPGLSAEIPSGFMTAIRRAQKSLRSRPLFIFFFPASSGASRTYLSISLKCPHDEREAQ